MEMQYEERKTIVFKLSKEEVIRLSNGESLSGYRLETL